MILQIGSGRWWCYNIRLVSFMASPHCLRQWFAGVWSFVRRQSRAGVVKRALIEGHCRYCSPRTSWAFPSYYGCGSNTLSYTDSRNWTLKKNNWTDATCSDNILESSWLQFPLQNQGCWGPKNLRFWRASLKPNRATESRTMGWQPPKNHQFWSFLDPILVGPWFCRLVKLGAPTLSWECTKPYILGKELILEKIRWCCKVFDFVVKTCSSMSYLQILVL